MCPNPAEAILTTPPPVANEVAPVYVETEVSPVTSKVVQELQPRLHLMCLFT